MSCARSQLIRFTRAFCTSLRLRYPQENTWQLPEEGYCIGNFDGSIWENYITCGGIIRTADGKMVECFTAKFPYHSNSTVAELHGLDLLLEMVLRRKIDWLKLETDNREINDFMGRALESYKKDKDLRRRFLFEETSKKWLKIANATHRHHRNDKFGNQTSDHLARIVREQKDIYDPKLCGYFSDPDEVVRLDTYDLKKVLKPKFCRYFTDPGEVVRLDKFLEKDLESAWKNDRW